MRSLLVLLGLACACDNWSGAGAGVDAGARYPALEPPMPQMLSRGGPVLASPRLVAVTFTDDTDTSGLEQYFGMLVASPWWDVLGEYGVGAATVGAVHVAAASPAAIDDADIKTWLADRIASDASFGNPEGTLFVIFYSSATTVTILGHTLCTDYGAYHDEAPLGNGGRAAYAVIPVCAAGFNGFHGFALRTVLASHEIAEAVTDPFIKTEPAYNSLTANDQLWVLLGYELADVCIDDRTGATATASVPEGYTSARVWSNRAALAGHDPCQPSSDVYFNAVPEMPDAMILNAADGGHFRNHGVHILEGDSATIPLDLYSDGPTDAPWTVSAEDLAGVLGYPHSLAFSFDRTEGENGDRIEMTVQVLHANASQGGEVFWVVSTQGDVQHDWIGAIGSAP